MCVIIHFAPGSRMNKEQFFNAVHNNWHGFGLILKDGNDKLQLIKGYKEEGTDPEELYKLIEDNHDIDRYLHVRHSTKGATDETNVQPFSAYNSSSRQVFFMHNGTLTGFGESGGVGKSDTLCFVEQILQPSLLSWFGPEGKADYTDKMFQKLVVDKQWTYSSTGLFVSNDLEPYRLGNGWTLYNHPTGVEDSQGAIWVSNTLYFNRVQRGPRFQKLEEERKAREAQERAASQKAVEESQKAYSSNEYKGSQSGIAPWEAMEDEDLWAYYRTTPGNQTQNHHEVVQKFESAKTGRDPVVIRAMNTVINSWDLDDPEDITRLCSVAYEEWLEWLEEDVENGMFTTAALIEHMAKMVRKVVIRNATLEQKHSKASKRIEALSLKLKEENIEIPQSDAA